MKIKSKSIKKVKEINKLEKIEAITKIFEEAVKDSVKKHGEEGRKVPILKNGKIEYV